MDKNFRVEVGRGFAISLASVNPPIHLLDLFIFYKEYKAVFIEECSTILENTYYVSANLLLFDMVPKLSSTTS